MIVYCAGPLRGDTTYQNFYKDIIKIVEDAGHTALAELNGKFSSSIPLTSKQIYTRDIKWIDRSGLMIAETSGPSLGVGFEIAYALFEKKIHVLALIKDEVESISAMIEGCDSDLLSVENYYSTEDLKTKIGSFLKKHT